MKPIPASRVNGVLAVVVASIFVQAAVAAARPPLGTHVQDPRRGDANERARPAAAPGDRSARADPAAKALVDALGDPEEKVRKHAIDALTDMGSTAFRELAVALRDCDNQRRLLIFDVLGRIAGSWNYKPGPALKNISPALVHCLDDKEPDIRSNAASCLGMLRDAASVPHLLKLLDKEEDIEVRADAILACGCFGEAGKQAIPVLARIVVEEDDKELFSWGSLGGYASLGDRAAASLTSIGEPAAPALGRIVADRKLKPAIRCMVLRAISLESQVSHTKFAAAIPAMCIALTDREEKVRSMAIYALKWLDSTDKAVLAALRSTMSDDRDPFIRIKAASAIYQLDKQVKVILPTLLRSLEDKDLRVRRFACSALADMRLAAQQAIPKLIPLASDPDDDLRLAAVRALGNTGPAIAPAVPALTIAAGDPKKEIRQAAQEGLKEAKRWASKP